MKLLAGFFVLVGVGAIIVGAAGNPLSFAVAAVALFSSYFLWKNVVWGAAGAAVLMALSIVLGILMVVNGNLGGIVRVGIGAAVCWYLYSIRRRFNPV